MTTFARLGVEIDADLSGLNKGLASVQGSISNFGRELTSMGKNLSAAVTLPLVGLGGVAVKLAADAQESASKMEAVFGSATVGMNAWIAELRASVPATTADLQGFASSIQDLLVPLGMAPRAAEDMTKEVVRLAADLASFNNIPMAEALERIRSGMVGQYEPLLNFGVALSASTVEAEALRQGLVREGEELNANARAQAAFALILKGTTAAHGDAAKTAGSAANSMKFLATDLKEVGSTIGEILLPMITPLVQKLSEITKRFQELSPETQKTILVIGGIAAAVGPVLVVLGTLFTVLGGAAPIVLALGAAAVAMAASWIKTGADVGPVINRITSLGQDLWAKVGPALKNIGEAARDFGNKATTVFSVLSGEVNETSTTMSLFGFKVLKIFKEQIEPRIKAIMPLFEKLGEIVSDIVTEVIIPNLKKLAPVFEALGPLVMGAVDLFTILGKIALHVVDVVILPIFKKLVDVVTSILGGPLKVAIESAAKVLEFLADKFEWLYDVVVGNSYVPDMVSEVVKEFEKMKGETVTKTTALTVAIANRFDELSKSTRLSTRDMVEYVAERMKHLQEVTTGVMGLVASSTEASSQRFRTAMQGNFVTTSLLIEQFQKLGGTLDMMDVTQVTVAENMGVFGGAIEQVSKKVNGAIGSIGDALHKLMSSAVGEKFTSMITTLLGFTGAGGLVAGLGMAVLGPMIRDVLGKMGDFVKGIGSKIGNFLGLGNSKSSAEKEQERLLLRGELRAKRDELISARDSLREKFSAASDPQEKEEINALRRQTDTAIAQIEQQAQRIGGFASGGFHMGGLRIVGERGPELEATGASRIWSASQTRDMLSGGASSELMLAQLRVLQEGFSRLQNGDAATQSVLVDILTGIRHLGEGYA